MARLAIAKGFLAEYAKLEKNVQNAVESAISRFAEHTHAGLHLEKLQHSRDDRIRTIRVDSFWRGVVLAPAAGDTYCLITVLPHDKANAYAASRRFSVNQALGILEVRDEEAIQQLRPSLQAVAQEDRSRLFTNISDSDLTRLGVDAQLLPLVRLLSSDAHLDALENVLPEPSTPRSARWPAGCRWRRRGPRWRSSCRPSRQQNRSTLATSCRRWNAHPARSPSCPARRSCSGCSPIRSRPGELSCSPVSGRSRTGRATRARRR